MGTWRRLHHRKLANRDPEDDLHLRDVARLHRHVLDRFQACHQRCIQDTARRDACPGWTAVFCDFVSLDQILKGHCRADVFGSRRFTANTIAVVRRLGPDQSAVVLIDGAYVDLHDAQPQCCHGCYC